MSSLEDNILDAVETIVEDAVSNLSYDKTIRATISEIIDKSTGKYKLRYQDSLFYAYASDPDVTYSTGTAVYVQVLSSDFNKNSIIVGTVAKLGTEYLTATSEEDKYNQISKNLLNDNIELEMSSYWTDTYVGGQVNCDKDEIQLCGKNSPKYLKISADFKTSLKPQQRTVNGEYGLLLKCLYYNEALTEKSDAQNLIERTYSFSSNQMRGQPYAFSVWENQYLIIPIEGEYLYDISEIYLYATGFNTNQLEESKDIYVKNIQIYLEQELTEEQKNSASLTIIADEGSSFNSVNENKTLTANVKLNGKDVNLEEQKISFYWFVLDASVDANSQNKFCSYGGDGWRCLNTFIKTDSLYTVKPASNTLTINSNDFLCYSNTFKCVAVFSDSTTASNKFVFYNNLGTTVSITSSAGEIFPFDIGKTTLTCITSIDNDWTYKWKHSSDGVHFEEDSSTDSSISDIHISQTDDELYYICSVYLKDNLIGSAQILLKNGSEDSEYTLSIINGNKVYKYDEYGTSPASPSVEEQSRIEIQPMSFQISDKNGNIVDFESEEDKEASCEIYWYCPDPDDSMLEIYNENYKENFKIGLTTATENKKFIVEGDSELIYKIKNKYDSSKKDNNILLVVFFQSHMLTALSSLSFTKDGELGTNGTKYSARVSTGNYEEIYIKNGKVIGRIGAKETDITNSDQLSAQLWGDNTVPETYNSVTWNLLNLGYTINGKNISISDSTGKIDIINDLPGYPYNSNNVYSTIAKITITASNLVENVNKFYASYPIKQVYTNNDEFVCYIKDGFNYVEYSSDGTRPSYPTKSFSLVLYRNGSKVNIEASKITWSISWSGGKGIINDDGSFDATPPNYFISENLNNYVICEYDGILRILIPIHFYLERYGMAAMNDWDGNSIEIKNDTYILAPQIGAGQKENDNSFTGVTMGTSFYRNADGTTSSKVGLFGFSSGEETFFLNSKSGALALGKSGNGQIILDPSNNKSLIKSSGYDNGSTGMQIDLLNETINTATGNFSVDKNGYLTAKGGGSIGGWKIGDDTLSSSDGSIVLDGEDGEIKAANGNFKVNKEGHITAKAGTIGGWNVSADTLKSSNGNVSLYSNGTLSSTAGAGWSINSNGSASFGNMNYSGGSISPTSINVNGTSSNIKDWVVDTIKASTIIADYLQANLVHITDLQIDESIYVGSANNIAYLHCNPDRFMLFDSNGREQSLKSYINNIIESSDLNSLFYGRGSNSGKIIGASDWITTSGNEYPLMGSAWANCTWSVWEIAYAKLGIKLPNYVGNAKNWYTNLNGSYGYSVGSTPKNNSIVVFKSWSTNSYGHVAFVNHVNSDGTIDTLEGGVSGGFYAWNKCNPNARNNGIYGYVYLK